MSRNYIIVGTKRSGHHAIINWLIPQIGGTVRHFNDQRYFRKQVDEVDADWYYKCLRLHYCRILSDDGREKRPERYEEFINIPNVVSFEETKPSVIFENANKWITDFDTELKRNNKDFKIENNNEYILVIRNPWNIMASHLKWKNRVPMYARKNLVSNIWNDMYQIYSGEKNSNVYVVLFDKWFSDIEYRKKISE